jgi:hypothetical protein
MTLHGRHKFQLACVTVRIPPEITMAMSISATIAENEHQFEIRLI